MSVDLHYQYYSRECNNPKVLPYLDIPADLWWSGRFVLPGFYETCNDFGEWDADNKCWIFSDVNKLFSFASLESVPPSLADYITDKYRDELVFILWKR